MSIVSRLRLVALSLALAAPLVPVALADTASGSFDGQWVLDVPSSPIVGPEISDSICPALRLPVRIESGQLLGALTRVPTITGGLVVEAGSGPKSAPITGAIVAGDPGMVLLEGVTIDGNTLAISVAGTVAGFSASTRGMTSDTLDLRNIDFASGISWSFDQTTSSQGVLSVADGDGDTANITLPAQYITIAATVSGGTSSGGSTVFRVAADDITDTTGTLFTTKVHT